MFKRCRKKSQLVIFFNEQTSDIKKKKIPLILITKKSIPKNNIPGELIEYIKMPFKILDFQKKVVSLMAKSSFKKNSFDYVNSTKGKDIKVKKAVKLINKYESL